MVLISPDKGKKGGGNRVWRNKRERLEKSRRKRKEN